MIPPRVKLLEQHSRLFHLAERSYDCCGFAFHVIEIKSECESPWASWPGSAAKRMPRRWRERPLSFASQLDFAFESRSTRGESAA